jgi:hypothetical protein
MLAHANALSGNRNNIFAMVNTLPKTPGRKIAHCIALPELSDGKIAI